MVNDDLVPHDARPNKKAKQAAKNDTQASGSNGKSPTGRKSHKSLNIYHK